MFEVLSRPVVVPVPGAACDVDDQRRNGGLPRVGRLHEELRGIGAEDSRLVDAAASEQKDQRVATGSVIAGWEVVELRQAQAGGVGVVGPVNSLVVGTA